MKHAARWTVLIASLLLVAWVALFTGPGAQAPKAPPLPTPATTK